MIKVLFKSEELLIAADSESKVVAKHIKVTIKTEVVVKTAKSSVVKTAEDALRIADKFGLKAEVQRKLDNGATPLDALREWDIIQSIRVLSKTLNCSLFINRDVNK